MGFVLGLVISALFRGTKKTQRVRIASPSWSLLLQGSFCQFLWNQLPLNASFNSSVSGSDDLSISLDTNNSDDILETLKPFTNNVTLGSFNINSLAGKFSQLLEWVEAFDILYIHETNNR